MGKISALPTSTDIEETDDLVVNSAANGTVRVPLKNIQIGHVYSVTVPVNGWSGDTAPFVQTVNVDGLSADHRYLLTANMSSYSGSASTPTEYYRAYAALAGGIITTAKGSVTFQTWKKPGITLVVNLVG